MRLTSLPGRGTEDQIENLNTQFRQITNPGRDYLFFYTPHRKTVSTVAFLSYMYCPSIKDQSLCL